MWERGQRMRDVVPFGPKDRDAGYWPETSMQQVEISRIIVFDAPRHARGFFEALVADNLDIGRPHNVEIIFGRKLGPRGGDEHGPAACAKIIRTSSGSLAPMR